MNREEKLQLLQELKAQLEEKKAEKSAAVKNPANYTRQFSEAAYGIPVAGLKLLGQATAASANALNFVTGNPERYSPDSTYAYQAGERLRQFASAEKDIFGNEAPPVPEVFKRSLPGQLASGAGSLVGPLGLGLLGKAAPFVGGSVQGAESQLEDAQQNDASGLNQILATLGGAAVGAAEGIPIEGILAGSGSRLVRGMGSGVTEGTQEAVSGGASDSIAGLTYDESRNPLDFEKRATEFAIGGLVGGATAAALPPKQEAVDEAPPPPSSLIDRDLDEEANKALENKSASQIAYETVANTEGADPAVVEALRKRAVAEAKLAEKKVKFGQMIQAADAAEEKGFQDAARIIREEALKTAPLNDKADAESALALAKSLGNKEQATKAEKKLNTFLKKEAKANSVDFEEIPLPPPIPKEAKYVPDAEGVIDPPYNLGKATISPQPPTDKVEQGRLPRVDYIPAPVTQAQQDVSDIPPISAEETTSILNEVKTLLKDRGIISPNDTLGDKVQSGAIKTIGLPKEGRRAIEQQFLARDNKAHEEANTRLSEMLRQKEAIKDTIASDSTYAKQLDDAIAQEQQYIKQLSIQEDTVLPNQNTFKADKVIDLPQETPSDMQIEPPFNIQERMNQIEAAYKQNDVAAADSMANDLVDKVDEATIYSTGNVSNTLGPIIDRALRQRASRVRGASPTQWMESLPIDSVQPSTTPGIPGPPSPSLTAAESRAKAAQEEQMWQQQERMPTPEQNAEVEQDINQYDDMTDVTNIQDARDKKELGKFQAELLDKVRKKAEAREKELQGVDFQYEVGDVVKGSLPYRYKIIGKTLVRNPSLPLKEGRAAPKVPGYHIEYTDSNGDTYVMNMAESGIKGKFGGLKSISKKSDTDELPKLAEDLYKDIGVYEVYEAELSGMDFDEALQWSIDNRPEFAPVMQRIQERISELKQAGFKFSMGFDESIQGLGAADRRGNIKIKPTSAKGRPGPYVVQHEVVHAATNASIELGRANPNTELGKAVKELDNLFDFVSTRLKNRIAAGLPDTELHPLEKAVKTSKGNMLKNTHELVAWGFSDSLMQDYLKSFKAPKSAKSMWSKFVDSVRNILKIPKDSAFERLLEATDSVMNIDARDVKALRDAGNPVKKIVDQMPDITMGEINNNPNAIPYASYIYESMADDAIRRGMPDVGKAVTDAIDFESKVKGVMNDSLLKIGAFRKKMTSADRKQLDAQRQLLGELFYDNRIKEAEQLLADNPNLAREYAEQRKATQYIAKVMSDVGATITRANGAKVPFSALRNYMPGLLKTEWEIALRNPTRHPKAIAEIAKILHKHKRIKEPTADAVIKFLGDNNLHPGRKAAVFGNTERERTHAFPSELMDFSLAKFEQYRDGAAKRAAQIKHFEKNGTLDPKKGSDTDDVFMTATPIDEKDRAWLNKARDRVYGFDTDSSVSELFGSLNQIATSSQLATPAATMRNLIGGMYSTLAFNGWSETAKGLVDLVSDRQKYLEEAIGEGAIDISDFLQMSADAYNTNKVTRGITKGTQQALDIAGFRWAEQTVRLLSYTTAKHATKAAIKAYNKDPNSNASRRFKSFVEGQNIPFGKLLTGDSDVAAKWLRKQVNLDQGSYKLDQSPLYSDTPTGRFFLKYQKWGLQHMRTFDQKVYKPSLDAFKQAKKEGDVVKMAGAFSPVLSYLAAMVGSGISTLEVEELLFGRQNELNSLTELFNTEQSFTEWLDKTSHTLTTAALAAGAMGVFSGIWDKIEGIGKYNDGSISQAMTPPGLSLPINVTEAMAALYVKNEDGKLTSDQVVDALRRLSNKTLPVGKQLKEAVVRLDSAVGTDFFEMAADAQYGRQTKQLAQFAIDKFLEESDKYEPFRGRFASSNPQNRAIADALYAGSPETVKEMVKERITEAQRNNKDKDTSNKEIAARIKQSVAASVVKSHPLNVGRASGEKAREDFLVWYKDYATDNEWERVVAEVIKYEDAAVKAGVMSGNARTSIPK